MPARLWPFPDVSDDSLIDYDFKFYYDTDLSNEFVSTGTSSLFSVIQTQSTSGISTLYTINYNDNLPTKLYYSFAKNGVAVDPDSDVKDGSEILYTDSFYNGKYKVKGYMMSRSIWQQMMNTTLNEAQFCKISTRIPMPINCNPDCVL